MSRRTLGKAKPIKRVKKLSHPRGYEVLRKIKAENFLIEDEQQNIKNDLITNIKKDFDTNLKLIEEKYQRALTEVTQRYNLELAEKEKQIDYYRVESNYILSMANNAASISVKNLTSIEKKYEELLASKEKQIAMQQQEIDYLRKQILMLENFPITPQIDENNQ